MEISLSGGKVNLRHLSGLIPLRLNTFQTNRFKGFFMSKTQKKVRESKKPIGFGGG